MIVATPGEYGLAVFDEEFYQDELWRALGIDDPRDPSLWQQLPIERPRVVSVTVVPRAANAVAVLSAKGDMLGWIDQTSAVPPAAPGVETTVLVRGGFSAPSEETIDRLLGDPEAWADEQLRDWLLRCKYGSPFTRLNSEGLPRERAYFPQEMTPLLRTLADFSEWGQRFAEHLLSTGASVDAALDEFKAKEPPQLLPYLGDLRVAIELRREAV